MEESWGAERSRMDPPCNPWKPLLRVACLLLLALSVLTVFLQMWVMFRGHHTPVRNPWTQLVISELTQHLLGWLDKALEELQCSGELMDSLCLFPQFWMENGLQCKHQDCSYCSSQGPVWNDISREDRNSWIQHPRRHGRRLLSIQAQKILLFC